MVIIKNGIRIVLRGKAHSEWKAIVSGDQRNLEDDQYFIDERDIIFGKDFADGYAYALCCLLLSWQHLIGACKASVRGTSLTMLTATI
ncbi:hypothetical protein PGB90_004298 [Kerria lacca]